MMTDLQLAQAALEARKAAYSPYSGFCVGAALAARSGRIFTGCNIENAAYSPTVCAERVALFSAVAQGERVFTAIAIAGGPRDAAFLEYCPPCGVCRQTLIEFCHPDAFRILLVKDTRHICIVTLRELLPRAFSPASVIQQEVHAKGETRHEDV